MHYAKDATGPLNIVAYRPLPDDLKARISTVHTLHCVDPFTDPGAFEALLPEAHGLIGTAWKIDRRQLDLAPQLRVLSSISAGIDHVDGAVLRARGIALCHTKGKVEECVADTAFALMLHISRRLPEMIALVRSGQWRKHVGPELFGHDVHGKTLGLLGFGGISQAIARRAACGFGMTTLYHCRKPVALDWEPRAASREPGQAHAANGTAIPCRHRGFDAAADGSNPRFHGPRRVSGHEARRDLHQCGTRRHCRRSSAAAGSG